MPHSLLVGLFWWRADLVGKYQLLWQAYVAGFDLSVFLHFWQV